MMIRNFSENLKLFKLSNLRVLKTVDRIVSLILALFLEKIHKAINQASSQQITQVEAPLLAQGKRNQSNLKENQS